MKSPLDKISLRINKVLLHGFVCVSVFVPWYNVVLTHTGEKLEQRGKGKCIVQ